MKNVFLIALGFVAMSASASMERPADVAVYGASTGVLSVVIDGNSDLVIPSSEAVSDQLEKLRESGKTFNCFVKLSPPQRKAILNSYGDGVAIRTLFSIRDCR